jgi:DNA-binding HxlR family transcriptional regulator
MATESAAARRRAEALAYQEYVRSCPTSRLLDRIGDKWVTLLLVALADGPRRYGELSRAVPGASQKMLTQTLRGLERDGLVARAVTPSVPVRVDYRLTGLGESLLPVLSAIKNWAERHIDEVDAARERYDATRPQPIAEANRRSRPASDTGAERYSRTARNDGAERYSRPVTDPSAERLARSASVVRVAV